MLSASKLYQADSTSGPSATVNPIPTNTSSSLSAGLGDEMERAASCGSAEFGEIKPLSLELLAARSPGPGVHGAAPTATSISARISFSARPGGSALFGSERPELPFGKGQPRTSCPGTRRRVAPARRGRRLRPVGPVPQRLSSGASQSSTEQVTRRVDALTPNIWETSLCDPRGSRQSDTPTLLNWWSTPHRVDRRLPDRRHNAGGSPCGDGPGDAGPGMADELMRGMLDDLRANTGRFCPCADSPLPTSAIIPKTPICRLRRGRARETNRSVEQRLFSRRPACYS